MVTLVRRSPPDAAAEVRCTLALTAEERSRSRYRLTLDDGTAVHLQLPRGTVLREGDLLEAENGQCWGRVVAKPEPVLTVRGQTPFDLLRAAYHLGNRHVALELQPTLLRLSPDPVLQALVEQLGLKVEKEVAPFQPEAGAYHGTHEH